MTSRYARIASLAAKHRHWLALAAVAALGLLWWAQSHVPPGTMVLRNDGFHPAELFVEPGETVTFVNESSHVFWPASNGHPQHDRYPEFDAGRPLQPGESWTFRFDREGKWGLHDHIRSYYTGSVVVGEAARSYDCIEHLGELNLSGKRDCWDDALAKELREEGAASAFRKFSEFYSSDPDFLQIGCHIIAHRMGDVAYGEYVKYGNDLSKLEFPPESLYCGYGYYHGILEHMIRDNPDFEKADAFCKDLIAEYEDTVPRIRLNCYHAIGHGFIPEPKEVEEWGDPYAITAPAHEACRRIEDNHERIECLQGSFNVLADWMWNNQFGFRMPPEDPMGICATFPDRQVQQACYYELSMKVIPLGGDDINEIYRKFASGIADDEFAGMIINSAMAGITGVNIGKDDFVPLLKECRALPGRVEVECLKGLTGGFVAHGPPEKEWEKAVGFCTDPALTAAEKEVCYFNIFRTFHGVYPADKVAQICLLIEPEYRDHCAPTES